MIHHHHQRRTSYEKRTTNSKINEKEDKIIGKKEVKTEYYSESKEIKYFVIEEVEDESIVKLIEKMLVNIILTGCNGGLC